MPVELIISLICHDRPGVVETTAKIVTDHSGNWIDSAMTRLGEAFAGIVRVSLPAENVSAFETAIYALSEQGIDVRVRRIDGSQEKGGLSAHLDVTGSDHPGIVHEISKALARHGVSIQALQTEITAGSMSGQRLFVASADIVIPDSVDAEQLGSELEQLAHDIMVDIAIGETN